MPGKLNYVARMITAVMLLSLVVPAFMPMLEIGEGAAGTVDANGNISVGIGEYLKLENDLPNYGNISVNGGTLVLQNMTITMRSDYGIDRVPGTTDDNIFWIEVINSGELYMDNTVITVEPALIDSHLPLEFTVDDSTMMANESSLLFPGWLNITNNAMVYLNDSIVDTVSDPVTYGGTVFFRDHCDDAPLINIDGAELFLADTMVNNLYDMDTENIDSYIMLPDTLHITLDNATGTSTELEEIDGTYNEIAPGEAVYIDNFIPPTITVPDDVEIVGYTDIKIIANLNATTGYNGTASLNWSVEGNTWETSSIIPADGDDFSDEEIPLSGVYDITTLSTLNVSLYHNGDNGSVFFDMIVVEVTPVYGSGIIVENGGALTAVGGYIGMDLERPVGDDSYHNLYLKDTSTAHLYGVSGPELEGGTLIPGIYLEESSTAEALMYAMIEVDVRDGSADYLDGADVTAEWIPSGTGVTHTYVETVNDITGEYILDYLARTHPLPGYITDSTYNVSDTAGSPVRIPVLTNIINLGYSWNGHPVSPYVVNITKGGELISNEVSFSTYPDMYSMDSTTVYCNGVVGGQPLRNLTVTGITYTPMYPMYGDTITLTANISNLGAKDVVGEIDVNLTSMYTMDNHTTITDLAAGATKQVVIDVTYPNLGSAYITDDLTIAVDVPNKYNESSNMDNSLTIPLQVNDTYDIDITSFIIETSDMYAVEGNDIHMNTTVTMYGGAAAQTIDVAYYMGDPDENGTWLGSQPLTLDPHGTGTDYFIWNAVGPGGDPIYVRADNTSIVPEDAEYNNEASSWPYTYIYSTPHDLLVHDRTFIIEADEVYGVNGRIMVSHTGVLIINGTLEMREESTEFFVMDGGTLDMNGGTVISTDDNGELKPANFFMGPNSTFTATSGNMTLPPLVIGEIVFPSTYFTGGETNIENVMFGYTTVEGYDTVFNATNCTFDYDLDISDSTTGILTNTSTPLGEILANDGAEIDVWWHLNILAVDAAGMPLPDVNVTAKNLIDNATYGVTSVTDMDGQTTLTLYGSHWSGDIETIWGSFLITGEHMGTFADNSIGVAMYDSQNLILEFSAISPDPYVEDISLISPAIVRDGQLMTINVTLNNTGPTTSNVTAVLYVDGTTEDNGTELARYEGMHLAAGVPMILTIEVDSTGMQGVRDFWMVLEDVEADADYNNNLLNATIPIEPASPDLQVHSIIFDQAQNVIGSNVQMTIAVNNTGTLDAAGAIRIHVYDETSASQIGSVVTVTNLVKGQTKHLNITWSLTEPAGLHNINVTVDYGNYISELNETNNFLIEPFLVRGKANLTITDDMVSFNNTTPMFGDMVQITADMFNHGQEWANGTVFIEFIDTLYGEVLDTQNPTISLDTGDSAQYTFDWTPATSGLHTIEVKVTIDTNITETLDTDNSGSHNIIVYRDGDLVVENTENLLIDREGDYPLTGYVLVKDDGVLVIDGSTLKMIQDRNNEFNIIVQDNGRIEFINGASLETTANINFYLYDNAELVMEGGAVDSFVDIIADKPGSVIDVTFIDVEMNGDFSSQDEVETILTAVNTSFAYPIDQFGENSTGTLTNCDTEYVALQDYATIDVYAWVEIIVVDANGEPIAGAVVEPRFGNTPGAVDGISEITGTDGKAIMALNTDELIVSTGQAKALLAGVYDINVTFVDVRTDTHTEQDPIDLPIYQNADGANSIGMPGAQTLVFQLENVKPNLDPPLYIDDAEMPKGGTTTIRTEVTNNGLSAAHDLMVRFIDNTTKEIIEDVILDTPLGVDETIYLNITHTFTDTVGDHEVIVFVNPPYIQNIGGMNYFNFNSLEEETMDDNTNTTTINIYGLPDLEVDTITTDGQIVEGSIIPVNTVISNVGDNTSDFTAHAYLDEIGNYSRLIGVMTGTVTPELQGGAPAGGTIGYWNIEDGTAGTHMIYVVIDENSTLSEYDIMNNVFALEVTVLERADMEFIGIQTSSNIVSDGEQIDVTANVRNNGDITADTVEVRFYIDEDEDGDFEDHEEFARYFINSINPNTEEPAYATWFASSTDPSRTFTIGVVVNPDGESLAGEYSLLDNTGNKDVEVLLTRDLTLVQVDIDDMNNTHVNITAKVLSTNQRSSDVVVRFYDDINGNGVADVDEAIGDYTIAGDINAGSDKSAYIVWNSLNSTQNDIHTIIVEVNPDMAINEINYTNSMSIILTDPRSDLMVTSAEFVSGIPQEGVSEMLNFTVANIGSSDFADAETFHIIIVDESPSGARDILWRSAEPGIDAGSRTVNRSDSINVSIPVVLIEVGEHNITIELDKEDTEHNGTITEFNETNNAFVFNQSVDAPDVAVNLNLPQNTVSGKSFIIRGTLSPAPANSSSVTVTLVVRDSAGQEIETTNMVSYQAGGSFSHSVTIAEDGVYTVSASVTYEGRTYTASDTMSITASAGGGTGIPMWMILLVIILIVLPIVLVTAYLYKYGLGNLVECGECNSLIPIGSAKCPKCNVEFEHDTAKCSVCGSWISMDASTCPECNAEFTVTEVTPEQYKEKMEKQYKTFLEPYLVKAMEEMGVSAEELTDEKFDEWWKAQPEFIAFEEWLSMEEEKRAAIKPVMCPECGSLNPSGSTTCYKCGMGIEAAEDAETPKEKPPAEPEKKEETSTPAATPVPVPTPAPEAKPETPTAAPAPEPAKQVVTRKVVAKPEEAKRVVVQKPAAKQVVTRKVVAKPQVVTKKVVKPGEENKEE